MTRFSRSTPRAPRAAPAPAPARRSGEGRPAAASVPVDESGHFDGFDALPHMPAVILQIQRALRSSRTDAQLIARLVSADVALTAQILRVVNSAYYGIGRQVLDLRFAVAYLGFDEIYRVVLAVSVVNGLRIRDQAALKRFWLHSYYCALIAKELGRLYERHIEPGELWPAALLHDVGELVYMKLYPDQYAALTSYTQEHRCLLAEAERALDAPSHTTLGAALCERWRLPEVVRDVCAHHELADPTSQPGSPRTIAFRRMVCAASVLTDIVVSDLDAAARDRLLVRVEEVLSIERRESLTLLADVVELREQAEEFTREIV